MGENNSRKKQWFDIHPPVFWPGAILSLLFIVLTLVFNNTWTVSSVYSTKDDIGAKFRELTEEERNNLALEGGILVEEVNGGFLERSGVNEGRVIKSVNGEVIRTPEDLRSVLDKQFSLSITLSNDSSLERIYTGDGDLGGEFTGLTKAEKKELGLRYGVRVTQVKGGWLDKVGVRKGDVIKWINKEPVSKSADIEKILSSHESQPVDLEVVRRGIGTNIQKIFQNVQDSISAGFGWFFIALVNVFLVFLIYLAFSKVGRIKLGTRDEKPEFSTLAWFSMLFSAGMGIGIIFWSVAEPMYHYFSPPVGEGKTAEAAETAMNFTFLHWGLHAWAIYALVGMALAFFAFNQKLPLSIRSVFYPVLGDRIHGFWGNVIDTLAVISTLFGLATSLGFGVQQISAGLDYLGVLNDSVLVQVLLIVLITAFATTSVVLGIDKGVKVLSEWNIRVGGIFLLFMIIVGPSLFIFDSFIQNTGNYIQQVFSLSTWTETYSQTNWQNSWTVFYWSWWIAWSPFVGMFIARVSRGRTVREFVFGVLLVPSLLTFLWLSAFGGSAIYLELNELGSIAQAVQENVAVALFELLSEYPLFIVSSVIGIIMVTIFFVTSSDSGSLVVDSLTSGGKVDAPVGQRIFWAQTEGAVAAVLLLGGGLGALQTAVITTGLPFAFILILMCYSLQRGLNKEYAKEVEFDRQKERESYQELVRDLVERQKEEKKDR